MYSEEALIATVCTQLYRVFIQYRITGFDFMMIWITLVLLLEDTLLA